MPVRPTKQSPAEIRRLVQQLFDEINRKASPSKSGGSSGATMVGGGGGGSSNLPLDTSTDNSWDGRNQFEQMLELGIRSGIISLQFVSGLQGSGVRLYCNETSKWVLELDELRVRGTVTVAELLFQQTRTFNGSLMIGRTGTGKARTMTTQSETH